MSLLRWLLILVFVVMGWVTLSYLAGVLAPILAALGIAYLLNPIADRLVRLGMSRSVAAALLLVSFVALLVSAITLFAPKAVNQLSAFVQDMPAYFDNLNVWLDEHFGFRMPAEWKHYLQAQTYAGSGIPGPLRELAEAALGGVFQVLAVIAESLLVPVFAFYFLVDWPNLLRRIDHMVPPRKRRNVRAIATEIDDVVAGWVRGQAIVTAILAVLYAIGFTLVGMPLSLPIGLLVGALTVIPFVGTFVGATIALLVTLAGTGNLQTVGLVAGVIVFLHVLEAGFLTPKIVGHRVGLGETGALFAVVAGGKLLGFVGVVLAVPIAATAAVLIRAAVRYYEHTEFFGKESDADIVITPAMAIVMPGVVPTGYVMASDKSSAPNPAAAIVSDAPDDDWEIEPELGAAGAPPATKDEAMAPVTGGQGEPVVPDASSEDKPKP